MSDQPTKIRNFRIIGSYRQKREIVRFSREVRATKEADASEKVLLFLGSKHRIKRAHIMIKEIKEVSVDDLEDKIVKEFATKGETFSFIRK